MTQQIEQADLDEDWLYTKLTGRRINPTTTQVDTFCERVWEQINNGVSVHEARTSALTELFGRR